MGLLRLALAFAVVLTHLPPATFHFLGGGLAVQGFFIISGFYMALVLSGRYGGETGVFYVNRLLRLFPAYFVVMAVAAVALFIFNASATAAPEQFAAVYRHPAAAALLGFENLAMLGQEMLFWFKVDPNGAFLLDPANTPPTPEAPVAWQLLLVPQSWSLSMELMFYALAPFMVRARWQTLVAIAGASIALRYAGMLVQADYGLWQGRLFPTALFLFIFGMLGCRTLPFIERLPKTVTAILGWSLNALVLALVVAHPMLGLTDELGRWLVYVVIALAMPFIFHAFKDFTFDRWIGDLSYPIYLCHLIVVGAVLTYNPTLLGIGPVWIAIGATLVFATALLLLVDRPIDAWRHAWTAARRR